MMISNITTQASSSQVNDPLEDHFCLILQNGTDEPGDITKWGFQEGFMHFGIFQADSLGGFAHLSLSLH